MSKKSNYSYVGIAFILLVFGIMFVPKIMNRINEGDITRDESRSEDVSNSPIEEKKNKENKSDLRYLEINGTPKKVPAFSFTNQYYLSNNE